MIDPKDRPLFEALYLVERQGFLDAYAKNIALRWDRSETLRGCEQVLAHIRAAEGPEEAKDSGSQWLRDEYAMCTRLLTEQRTQLGAAEAIIHALVDNRHLLRGWYRDLTQAEDEAHRILGVERHTSVVEAAPDIRARLDAMGTDDPAGAGEEDELTDVERRAFEMLPATWEQLAHSIPESVLDEVIDGLWKIEALATLTERGTTVYHQGRRFQEPPKPSPRVLPAGTVIEGDLHVGMLVQVEGFGDDRITHIADGKAWSGKDAISSHPRRVGLPITLREDFTMPEESNG